MWKKSDTNIHATVTARGSCARRGLITMCVERNDDRGDEVKGVTSYKSDENHWQGDKV